MSKFVLEQLGKEHNRKGFKSGLESVDRYLKETARGHTELADQPLLDGARPWSARPSGAPGRVQDRHVAESTRRAAV